MSSVLNLMDWGAVFFPHGDIMWEQLLSHRGVWRDLISEETLRSLQVMKPELPNSVRWAKTATAISPTGGP